MSSESTHSTGFPTPANDPNRDADSSTGSSDTVTTQAPAANGIGDDVQRPTDLDTTAAIKSLNLSATADDLDEEEYPFPHRRSKNPRRVVLILALFSLLIIACLFVGVLIVMYVMPTDPTPTKLPGTWKTRFEFAGAPDVSIYIFKDNGKFREEAYDRQGKLQGISDGTWEYRNGKVRIVWHERSIEDAELTWRDDDTVEYHVVNHSDKKQIGLRPILRRQ